MALRITFTFKDGPQLETLTVDASVSETHSFSAQVTEFPVESGAAVSDNVRPNPETLRIEAFISDFPLLNAGRNQTSSGGIQGSQRPTKRTEASGEILTKLRRLQTEGIPVEVFTGLRNYADMILETIEVPRDKSLKNGIRANLSFKKIRVVKTQTVEVKQARETKGQRKVKGGPDTTKPASTAVAEKKGSLATQFVDSLRKAIPQ